MKVIMFKERFARLVESGTKKHTIRPPRKKSIKAGDILSLRQWTGLPYRSKQREVRRALCAAVHTVTMSANLLILDGVAVTPNHWDTFAKHDGFESWEELWCWFLREHGKLRFSGIVIYW